MMGRTISIWKESRILNRCTFNTLFIAAFTSMMGVGIVVPLLPVYARDLGASGVYVGLVFGAFSLSRSVFLPYFGRLSDKKGRKPFIVLGLFGYMIIPLAFMGSDKVEVLIAFRVLQGVAAAMILPVAQAYVGDITSSGDEGFNMGLFHMAGFMGLSIGPLVGGVIDDHLNLNAAFACMSALALTGFVFSLLLLPPTRFERVITRGSEPADWKHLMGDRSVCGLFVFRLVFTTCVGILWGFLPVYADSQFSLSSGAIGILLMLGIFTSGVMHVPMGAIADRFNKSRLMAAGGLIVVFAMIAFNRADNFRDLLWAIMLFGIGGGTATPALMAQAVIDGDRTGAMGSVMALMTLAQSMGMVSGSLLAGLLMDFSQLCHAFSFGAATMFMGIGFYSLLQKRRKNI